MIICDGKREGGECCCDCDQFNISADCVQIFCHDDNIFLILNIEYFPYDRFSSRNTRVCDIVSRRE